MIWDNLNRGDIHYVGMVNPVEICVNAVLELTNLTELTETRSIMRMKGSWSSSIYCERMKTVDLVYFQINWMKI